MTWARLWTNTQTSLSRKICCVKSGFQILYAVEQFSSLFSKDKLKQGAHIHQTHGLPSLRMSWENCCAVPSQQLPHALCGADTWRTRLGRKVSFIHRFFPTQVRVLLYAVLCLVGFITVQQSLHARLLRCPVGRGAFPGGRFNSWAILAYWCTLLQALLGRAIALRLC